MYNSLLIARNILFIVENLLSIKGYCMIQKARFNKKLTQKELGSYLGISQSYVSKIETRKTKSLSVSKILDLSLILELDPVEVFKFIAKL